QARSVATATSSPYGMPESRTPATSPSLKKEKTLNLSTAKACRNCACFQRRTKPSNGLKLKSDWSKSRKFSSDWRITIDLCGSGSCLLSIQANQPTDKWLADSSVFGSSAKYRSRKIGRASCRERVYTAGVAGTLQKT